MADVSGKFFSAKKVRTGVSPSSPGVIEGETLPPVNPPGSSLADYVPYLGATGNVDLGEFGLDTGFINLDTTPTNTPTTQGTIYWDDSKSTASLIMNGTIQHIGQDTFFYVKNSTGSSIPKGTAVRFAGTDGASGHLLITPFLANGSVPSTYFMGVTAEVIANGAFGQVMHFGELEGINTSAYTAGSLLYASTTVAGGFQTTVPVAPNNIVLIAATINSKNNGAILVRPTYGSNINTDEGVKITSPATGQLLQLQAGGLWENKTIAQVLGGTSSQFVKGDGSLDSTAYQPLLTNPVTGTGVAGQIAYFNGTSAITGESSLIWDATNDILQVTGSILPATDNTGIIGNSAFTWSNGQFTNLTIDSTLNVRAAIDLADNDILRFGSSDDWEFFHNGTNNLMDLNVGDLIIRDNVTTRLTIERTTGNIISTGGATFSSIVQATQFSSVGGRGTSFGYKLPDWQIYNTSSGNALAFSNYTTDFLTLSSTGAATFSSSLNALKGDFGTAFTSTNVLQAIAPSATNSDMFQVGMVGVSNGLTLKRVSSAFIMDWDGSAIFNGTLKTSSPTGSTAQPFKVGSVTTTTDSFFGTVLKMEINGTVYNIMIAEPPL